MKIIDDAKVYLAPSLLLITTLKLLIFGATIPDSIVVGFLALLTGWQIYITSLRVSKLQQQQINLIKKDVHSLKSTISTVQMLHASKPPSSSGQNPLKGFSW